MNPRSPLSILKRIRNAIFGPVTVESALASFDRARANLAETAEHHRAVADKHQTLSVQHSIVSAQHDEAAVRAERVAERINAFTA